MKRKAAPTAPAAAKKSGGWHLDSDSDDEAAARPRATEDNRLQSVLSRRVADGVLRRAAYLEGNVFIEIKIYNVADIVGVDPKDRWEKAVLNLKYQGDSDAPEQASLKEVVKLCRKQFLDEGKFFSNKKK